MTTWMRIVGVIALLFFISGCSGYRTLGNHYDPSMREGDFPGLRPGDQVRIIPRSADKIQGEVLEVGQESLTIMVRPSRDLNEEEVGEDKVGKYNYSDLKGIEVYQKVNPYKVVGVVLLVGVVVGLVLYSETENLRNGFFSSSSKSEGPILSKNRRMLP